MSELQQAFADMVSAEIDLRRKKAGDGEWSAMKRVWGYKLDRFRKLAQRETDTEAAARKLEALT